MYFKSDIHCNLFMSWLKKQRAKSNKKEAAIYLLSADRKLWLQVEKHDYDLDKFFLSKSFQSDYTILKAAEDLYSSEKSFHLTIADLACSDVVDNRTFDLIMQAIQIARYGAIKYL